MLLSRLALSALAGLCALPVLACGPAVTPRPAGPIAQAAANPANVKSNSLSVSAPAPAAAKSTQPEPRYLTTVIRPTALLLQGGLVITAGEKSIQRIAIEPPDERANERANEQTNQPVRELEPLPLPVLYPRRLLDGGGGWILLATQDGEKAMMLLPSSAPPEQRMAGRGPLAAAEDVARAQRIRALARDATHLYWINYLAPKLRRVVLRPPTNPDVPRREPPPEVEAVATLPEDLVDLAVDGGQIFLANASRRSLQRLEAGRPKDLTTLATFPAPPSALYLTADAVFVGSQDGAVYRVGRRDGSLVELGRAGSADKGGIHALAADRCFVLAAAAGELVAFESTRGVRVPLVDKATVTGLAATAGRIYYTDFDRSGLYSLPAPPCPGPGVSGPARPVAAAPPAPPPPPPEATPDNDPLAGKSEASLHTVMVYLGMPEDTLARKAIGAGVTRVLGDPAGEVWARATDAQVEALRGLGFGVSYRDGADRVRCVDVRKSPAAGRRPLPPPFFASGTSRVHVVQLAVPSRALPGLQDELATLGATLLEGSELATLYVQAGPSVMAKIARLPAVTWTDPYSPRERLLGLALGITQKESACGSDPDAALRGLAAWIKKDPDKKLELTALLFGRSPSFTALVRSEGGRVESSEETTVRLSIPRRALPALAAHPEVYVLEPYAEPTIATTPSVN